MSLLVVAHSQSHIWHFVTPWNATGQAPLFFTSSWICWNSCPLSHCCHPTISPSVIPFSSRRLSQHQGLFKWVSSLHQVPKLFEFQLKHQSIQWLFRTGFFGDGLVGSICCPSDSQESSPTQFKSINSSVLSFLYNPTLTSIHDHWKNHILD